MSITVLYRLFAMFGGGLLPESPAHERVIKASASGRAPLSAHSLGSPQKPKTGWWVSRPRNSEVGAGKVRRTHIAGSRRANGVEQ